MGLSEFFFSILIILAIGITLASVHPVINDFREASLTNIEDLNIVESLFIRLLMPIIWGFYILLSLLFLVLARRGIGAGI